MKNYKVQLFHFEELNDDAKHYVCNKERESEYNFGTLGMECDAEERRATIKAFCELFNISYDIDYDHQYRFVSWHFNDVDMNGYEWCDEDISGKYLLRYLNRYYFDILSRKWYHVNCKDENAKPSYKERYSEIQWISGNCPFTGMCYDCDILDPILKWFKNPDWNITLHDLFDDCFSAFMQSWEEEDDYRMSDENLCDAISANWEDKLFFEDGREFNGNEDDLEPLVA